MVNYTPRPDAQNSSEKGKRGYVYDAVDEEDAVTIPEHVGSAYAFKSKGDVSKYILNRGEHQSFSLGRGMLSSLYSLRLSQQGKAIQENLICQ